MKRRELLAALAAGTGIAAVPSIARAQGRPAGGRVAPAEAFVTTLTERGIASLTGRGTAESERARRFRQMLSDNFDVPTISRFVIGRYWRVATEPERQEYTRLFTDMLVGMYSSRLAEYQGEQIRVVGSRESAE